MRYPKSWDTVVLLSLSVGCVLQKTIRFIRLDMKYLVLYLIQLKIGQKGIAVKPKQTLNTLDLGHEVNRPTCCLRAVKAPLRRCPFGKQNMTKCSLSKSEVPTVHYEHVAAFLFALAPQTSSRFSCGTLTFPNFLPRLPLLNLKTQNQFVAINKGHARVDIGILWLSGSRGKRVRCTETSPL